MQVHSWTCTRWPPHPTQDVIKQSRTNGSMFCCQQDCVSRSGTDGKKLGCITTATGWWGGGLGAEPAYLQAPTWMCTVSFLEYDATAPNQLKSEAAVLIRRRLFITAAECLVIYALFQHFKGLWWTFVKPRNLFNLRLNSDLEPWWRCAVNLHHFGLDFS